MSSANRGGRPSWSFLTPPALAAALPLLVVALAAPATASATITCARTITARVVALDQPLTFNRLGAQNVNGIVYALRRDVINRATGLPLTPGDAATLRPDKRPRPLVLRVAAGDCLDVTLENLLAPAANPNNAAHAALQIDDQVAERFVGFHAQGLQLRGSIADDGSHVGANASSLVAPGASRTYRLFAEKEGSFLVTSPGATFGGEGSAGNSTGGLFAVVNVEPRGAKFYRSQVTEEELRRATTRTTASGHPVIDYSARYPDDCATGGVWCREGKANLPVLDMLDGGEIVHADLNAVITGPGGGAFPETTYPLESVGRRNPSLPNRLEPFRELTVVFHDEAVAAQAFPGFFDHPRFQHTLHGVRDGFMVNYGSGGVGAEIIANRLGVGPMHDCLDCSYEEFFLSSFAVGDPAMLVDVPANVGLETLAPGEAVPAGAAGPKATKALYPDDPSNVHHAYTGDFVKIRNVHVGKEHHVFHLHNHQWLFNPNDDNSNYIDAQGIGPGSGYTYELNFGGAGNRNKTAGDAIFHCHFYPHFAQGMWEHLRVHDVLETGTRLAASGAGFHTTPFALRDGTPAIDATSGNRVRALPDGEIVAGTPIPAVVPLPGKPMAPLPGKVELVANPNTTTASAFHPDAQALSAAARVVPVGSNAKVVERTKNPGYPFWIAGIEHTVGQRPPTPPLDMLGEAKAGVLAAARPALFSKLPGNAGGFDGGLPRHTLDGVAAGGTADVTVSHLDLTKFLTSARPVWFPEEGTDVEQAAMGYHAQREHPTCLPTGVCDTAAAPVKFVTNGAPPVPSAPYHDPCVDDRGARLGAGVEGQFFDGTTASGPAGLGIRGSSPFHADNPRTYKAANIQIDAVFNKVGYHYPQQRIIALWDDVAPTISKAKPPEPFVIRFNTYDCAKYLHTNLVPEVFELDDYQIRTPTDVIGQHIHLPKWDLTSADGSANGWNYEDGTLSPGAVQERIHAINRWNQDHAPGEPVLSARAHPFFGAGPQSRWLGARTTIQRWFFDPIVNVQRQHRGLGVIFTHDHYGPSTHQQIGLYASVLNEPPGSRWVHSETGVALNTRHDGGPTSWQAAILGVGDLDGDGVDDSHREFWFQASDFQHAYEKGVYVGAGEDGVPNPALTPTTETFRRAIAPSVKVQANPVFPDLLVTAARCPSGDARPCPEAISADDPGMFVVNYRNEPVALRVFDPARIAIDGKPGAQADGLAGDLAFALQTRADRAIPALNTRLGDTPYPALTRDVGNGDPFTPLMRAYAGEKVRVKVQIGGQEEELHATIHGMKWLQGGSGFGAAPNSGWRNAQAQGISEQFTFEVPILPFLGAPARADYAYSMSPSQDGWWSGAWGLLRSYNAPRPDLFKLPTGPAVPLRIANGRDFDVNSAGVCPRTAPVRPYDLTAVLANDVLPAPPGGVAITSATADWARQHAGAALDPAGGTLVFNPRTTGLSNGRSGPLHDPTAMLYVRTEELEAKDPTHQGCFKVDAKTGQPVFDVKLPTCPVRLVAGVPVEPIVLRAAAGECIEVTLRNRLPIIAPDLATYTNLMGVALRDRDGVEGVTTFNNNLVRPSSHVGLHPQLVAYDVTKADGTNVGTNPPQTAPPGGQARYRWYAGDLSLVAGRVVPSAVEFGGSNLVPADKVKQGQKALVGALVVLPPGTSWEEDPQRRSAASVGTKVGGGPLSVAFRDFTVVFQKQLTHRYADGSPVENIGTVGEVADDSQDAGQLAINNGSEPLWFRFGLRANAPFGNVNGGLGAVANARLAYANELAGGDPVTPVFRARAGQPLRMHVVEPHGGFRGSVFNLHGHVWQRDPYVCDGADLSLPGKCAPGRLGSRKLGSNPVGKAMGGQDGVQPYSHFDLVLPSAGGGNAVPGDYLFRDQAGFGNLGGLWGILRVEPAP